MTERVTPQPYRVDFSRVYLAAWTRRAAEMRLYASSLFRPRGLEVVSRWHNEENFANNAEVAAGEREARRQAMRDLGDIDASTALLMFTEGGKGGRHVELGYALGLRRRGQAIDIAVCGDRENVFHALAQIRHFPTVGALEGYLNR